MGFKSQTVMITGADGSLGQAVAAAFAAQRIALLLIDAEATGRCAYRARRGRQRRRAE